MDTIQRIEFFFQVSSFQNGDKIAFSRFDFPPRHEDYWMTIEKWTDLLDKVVKSRREEYFGFMSRRIDR